MMCQIQYHLHRETHTTHKENENATPIKTKEVFTYNEQNQLIAISE